MKNENKLLQAVSLLDRINQLTSDENIKSLVNCIQTNIYEFYVDNTRCLNTDKFNLWDYTIDDKMRPVYRGILHDWEHKMAVATNGNVLIADRSSFDESKVLSSDTCARQAIDKYGKPVDGCYPNWDKVIPKEEGYVRYVIDRKELKQHIKEAKAFIRMNKLNDYIIRYVHKETGTHFYAESLQLFLFASDGVIYIKNTVNAAALFGEDRRGVIMPMFPIEKFEYQLDNGLIINTK